jgi:hypothetical protein
MHRWTGPALLLLAAPALLAEPPGYGPFSWAQVQAGTLNQNNSACIKNSVGFGGAVGAWVGPSLGWEVSVLSASLKDQPGWWTARELHLDGSLLLAPENATGTWRPFLRGGLGASKLQAPLTLVPRDSTRLNLMAGAGVQAYFGTSGLATLEARGVNVRTMVPRTEVQLLAGLGFRWGGGTSAGTGRTEPSLPLPEPPPPVEQRQPEPGDQGPAVQPAPPSLPGQGPSVQPAPPSPSGQGPSVQPAPPSPPGQGPAVQPAPPSLPSQGPAVQSLVPDATSQGPAVQDRPKQP